ncbi:MAG TPA: group II truncated hemoglobin [Rhodocyclaceae bacterium]|jgi:hemoglobin
MNTPEQKTDPKPSVYERIGGEAAIRQLVKRFYELMDTLPEAYAVRKIHPQDLSGAEQKLFMYLSGYLGGPNLYVEQFGHPRLRARHMPFPIGGDERDQWLLCFTMAISEVVSDEPLRKAILKPITDLADFMRNKAESGETPPGTLPVIPSHDHNH